MDKKPAFYEKQRVRQWWIWAIILIPCMVPLGILLYQVITGEPVGDDPAPDFALVLMILIMGGLAWMTYRSVLETKIDDGGIHVKYSPFHRRWRHYSWDNVTGCEVKRFNPMMDYGGWGIKGNSYTVAGRMGMLVRFKDRYSQMIGTQKPDDLKRVLEQYGKLTVG